MTPITPEPVETLIRHAWDLYEQDSECDHAAHLRQAVQALSTATGEDVGDILSPIGDVAAWLGLDQ